MKVPVAIFVHRRPITTKLVFDSIKLYEPNKLYIFADGPTNETQYTDCRVVREIFDKNIKWDCKIEKIYSKKNLGLVNNIKKGLDYLFEKEGKAIILEDDTLPNRSFFKYCEFCLNKYEHDDSIFHISGCNFFPNSKSDCSSYSLTSIVNIWGWATWARAWKHYDVEMKSWKTQERNTFLKHWCTTKKQLTDTRAMFDLHCENKDPWTWDYQWVYTCWANNGLSVMPHKNLVQNLGFGPTSTHTKYAKQQNPYPTSIEELTFPITNIPKLRDLDFEKKYYKNLNISILRKIKSFLEIFFSNTRFLKKIINRHSIF